MSGEPDSGPDYSPPFREALRNAARPARRDLERVSIVHTEDGLAIHNPARRSVAMVLFLLAWLVGWGAGVNFALREIASGPLVRAIFLMFWLAIWSLAGLFVIRAVAWHWMGVERIFVLSGVLVVERGVGPWKRTQFIPLADLDGPHEKEPAPVYGGLVPLGTIAFSAHGKEITLGLDLSEAERAVVIEALRAELSHPEARLLKPRFGRD